MAHRKICSQHRCRRGRNEVKDAQPAPRPPLYPSALLPVWLRGRMRSPPCGKASLEKHRTPSIWILARHSTPRVETRAPHTWNSSLYKGARTGAFCWPTRCAMNKFHWILCRDERFQFHASLSWQRVKINSAQFLWGWSSLAVPINKCQYCVGVICVCYFFSPTYSWWWLFFFFSPKPTLECEIKFAFCRRRWIPTTRTTSASGCGE